MTFSKPRAYIKQIGIFLQDGECKEAYGCSEEFCTIFPGEVSSHYLLARSALALGKNEEAKAEARAALNLASGTENLQSCALLLCTCLYVCGEKEQAKEILERFASKAGHEADRLAFIINSSLEDGRKALGALEKMDRKMLKELEDSLFG